MKVSLKWLQKHIDAPLPNEEAVLDAFTFHAFEIEEAQGDLVDVKVLPNRAADCLSHRGVARELAAILNLPAKEDPLRTPLPAFPKSEALTVEIEDPQKCLRYMGAVVRGVKVGASPPWLKEALESVGQRSINNVVDATNYVMLNLGQPLHAFDAKKLAGNAAHAIKVRVAREGEKITTLSNETYELSPNILLITDAHADAPIGIAGIKGGKAAEVTADTTDLIIESANFDGTTTRRASQTLKLFTDASIRFQNRPSPELVAYAMRDVLALITDTESAGGMVEGVVDVYPKRPETKPVSVTLSRVNGLLGSAFTKEDVLGVFTRLGLQVSVGGETFTVVPPLERTDLLIAEDLIEEVGRIIGYDKIAGAELPPMASEPDQNRFRGMERMKDMLIEQGFTEVSTQSFSKKGDIRLANPLDKSKPVLRTSLEEGLADALKVAKQYAPLVLPPKEKPKLFEVGTVFPKEGEYLELRMTERVPAWGDAAGTVDNLSVAKLEDYGKSYQPNLPKLGAYKPYSVYPFVTRDIALWVPEGTDGAAIENVIRENATDLLVRLDQFDRFEKEGRVSYAFRLVFESMERTLTDEEVNGIMEKVYAALRAKGFEIR